MVTGDVGDQSYGDSDAAFGGNEIQLPTARQAMRTTRPDPPEAPGGYPVGPKRSTRM
jgi:hypothetical protein